MFIKTSLPKSLLSSAFHQFRHSNLQTSSTILDFRSKIHYYENNYSRMLPPTNNLEKMSPSDISANRIASVFLGNPSQMELNRGKKGENQNLQENGPSNSFIQIKLPLETDEALRNKFIRFKPEMIRVGRLMEALDFTATFVSYLHCHTEPLSRICTMVTVCVDHLKFYNIMRADRNILINSYPTFSGKSTIEIRTDLFQKTDNSSEENLVASALFLMAARDPIDYTKPYFIPKLVETNEEDPEKCRLRKELGRLNQEERKKLGSTNLFKSPPNQEESEELHNIFLSLRSNVVSPKDFTAISATMTTKSLLMHLQDRNVHGKIFGGYLMRESIEFAWLIAFRYTKGSYVEFEAIDDFYFLNAVDLGDIVDFEGKITFAEGNLIHVKVSSKSYSKVTTDAEEKHKKCTELHITFRCDKKVVPVLPETYAEGLNYLEGKRRVEKLLHVG